MSYYLLVCMFSFEPKQTQESQYNNCKCPLYLGCRFFLNNSTEHIPERRPKHVLSLYDQDPFFSLPLSHCLFYPPNEWILEHPPALTLDCLGWSTSTLLPQSPQCQDGSAETPRALSHTTCIQKLYWCFSYPFRCPMGNHWFFVCLFVCFLFCFVLFRFGLGFFGSRFFCCCFVLRFDWFLWGVGFFLFVYLWFVLFCFVFFHPKHRDWFIDPNDTRCYFMQIEVVLEKGARDA